MWQNITAISKLQTGDVLQMSGKIPFFPHYAVVYYKNGQIWVTHCIDAGINNEPLSQLEKRRTIHSVFRNEVTKKLTDTFIEQKANELSAYGYNFMESNCEDYVKRIVGTYIGMDDRVTAIITISSIIIVALTITIIVILRRR